MLHHQSVQASLSHQAHHQVFPPVVSSRRALATRDPKRGAASAITEHLPAESVASRRVTIRTATTNHEALAALKRSSSEVERQALRSQLVRNNLPLVYAITSRMGKTLALPQEDLRQIGSLGLLRAIDAFEPSRGRTLSSFAVPYIRGAIQHELRDRASLMRIPRPLWELRRRATVLQDRRRRLGQPQLAPAELAQALDCSTSQVVEALQVAAVVDMRSLDAPSGGEAGEEATSRTLLDLLPDPASLADAMPADESQTAEELLEALGGADSSQGRANSAAAPHPADGLRELAAAPRVPSGWPASPERSWLQQQLMALTPQEQALLLGHVCEGRSWADLGRELNLHPRQAQRRTMALLSRLQTEGQRWRDSADIALTPA